MARPRRSSRTAASPVPSLPPSEASDASEEEESDGEPIVPLLAGREKRSNAGNRMRALLEDEQGAEEEEMFKEEADDVDFETKEEQDVFDSDFGSTDSGSGDDEDGDGEDAGERKLQREAKEARKSARGKGKKKALQTPFLPSFARQTKAQQNQARASTSATTLDEDGEGSPAPPKKRRKKETDPAFFVPQRESSRKSALAFKKTVEEGLKEREQKRATAPKPKLKPTLHLTQADLISEALETEEINRASLLAFYAAEEDRRALERAAGMRYEIIGPKTTWYSRLEGVPEGYLKGEGGGGKGKEKEEQKDEGEEETAMESGRRRLIEVIGEQGKVGWSEGQEAGRKAAQEAREKEEKGAAAVEGSTTTAEPAPFASTSAPHPPKIDFSHPLTRLATSAPAPKPKAPRPPAGSIPGYSRNYLIVDIDVDEWGAEMVVEKKPTEEDWRVAVLGEGGRLREVKPTDPRHPLDPLTGHPALYLHPTLHVPYSTHTTYTTLQSMLPSGAPPVPHPYQHIEDDRTAGPFVWNGTLGAFTGREEGGLVGEVRKAAGGGGAQGKRGRTSYGMGRSGSQHEEAPTNPVALALWEAKREHEREMGVSSASPSGSGLGAGGGQQFAHAFGQQHQHQPQHNSTFVLSNPSSTSVNPYGRDYSSTSLSRRQSQPEPAPESAPMETTPSASGRSQRKRKSVASGWGEEWVAE